MGKFKDLDYNDRTMNEILLRFPLMALYCFTKLQIGSSLSYTVHKENYDYSGFSSVS